MAQALPVLPSLSGLPYIQVDGNLGAGKSFFIENVLCPSLVRLGFVPIIISEPVKKWEAILPLFYQDMKRWAYTFQTKIIFDRTQEVKRAWDEAQALIATGQKVVLVAERGVLSDRFFTTTLNQRGKIDDVEMASYNDWWHMWTELVPVTPDMIFFLTTNFETCCQRIAKRSRKGEESIDKDYLRHLLRIHEEAYLGKITYPVTPTKAATILEIDFSRNLIEFQTYQDQLMTQLANLNF